MDRNKVTHACSPMTAPRDIIQLFSLHPVRTVTSLWIIEFVTCVLFCLSSTKSYAKRHLEPTIDFRIITFDDVSESFEWWLLDSESFRSFPSRSSRAIRSVSASLNRLTFSPITDEGQILTHKSQSLLVIRRYSTSAFFNPLRSICSFGLNWVNSFRSR